MDIKWFSHTLKVILTKSLYKHKMKTKFLSFILLLLTTITFSQEVNFDIGTVNKKKYFEEINIELVYDKIVLPVIINGK